MITEQASPSLNYDMLSIDALRPWPFSSAQTVSDREGGRRAGTFVDWDAAFPRAVADAPAKSLTWCTCHKLS